MKLSDFTTEQAADAICRLLPHVQAISTDEELRGLLEQLRKRNPEELEQSAMQQIIFVFDSFGQLIPLLLRKHKADTMAILAILNRCSINTIKEQPVTQTIKQIKEISQDEDLRSLFI